MPQFLCLVIFLSNSIRAFTRPTPKQFLQDISVFNFGHQMHGFVFLHNFWRRTESKFLYLLFFIFLFFREYKFFIFIIMLFSFWFWRTGHNASIWRFRGNFVACCLLFLLSNWRRVMKRFWMRLGWILANARTVFDVLLKRKNWCFDYLIVWFLPLRVKTNNLKPC